MDKDITLGVVILVLGLSFITYLTIWSRRTIHRIAKKDSPTLREIIKDLHHHGR